LKDKKAKNMSISLTPIAGFHIPGLRGKGQNLFGKELGMFGVEGVF
jgi:hypothetical protein